MQFFSAKKFNFIYSEKIKVRPVLKPKTLGGGGAKAAALPLDQVMEGVMVQYLS